MSDSQIDAIARTVLYEGYLLYPYRPSAIKNRQRFNFGVLYPREYCDTIGTAGTDRSCLQVQCPLEGSDETRVAVCVRFLQLFERQAASGSMESWQDALEREVPVDEVSCGELVKGSSRLAFGFPEIQSTDLRRPLVIAGEVEVGVERVRPGAFVLTVRAINQSTYDAVDGTREEALTRALVSVHVVIRVSGGSLVSLLDPPGEWRDLAAGCSNEGVWPVLVGDQGSRDCMLASPIVLYDYPQIAPESPGDLFDGTEIDEILALRILTLTDEEKREARGADERARRILERTDAMPPEQWAKLHGAVRGLRRVTEKTS